MRRLLLVLLGVALALPATAQATEIGVNVSGAEPDPTGNAKATGVAYSRHFITWDAVEPSRKGAYDEALLQGFDKIVADLAAAQIKPILVFTGAPEWASGGADRRTPPRRVGDYADTIGMLARRWAGRVGAWEIWNEPDEPTFWTGAPEPERYAALLKAGHAAVKAADPSATVLTGPTTGNNYLWVERVVDAGAKGSFDGVSVHTDTACLVNPPTTVFREPDQRIGRFSFLGYRSVRQSLLARGIDVPIWMSELGWSATTSPCTRGAGAGNRASGVTEAQQAENLTRAYACLAKDPYVKAALWYVDRDRRRSDDPEDNYGLKRSDGSRRPAYAAFEDVARGRANLNVPCGDAASLGQLDLSVGAPLAGQRFDQSLTLSARSTTRGVTRIAFALKSPAKAIKSVRGTSGGLTWQGARRLAPGRYTVVVSAYGSGGAATSQEVAVERVDRSKLGPVATTLARTRLRGKGPRRRLTAALQAAISGLPGKVEVQWQRRRKGRWVRGARDRQNATRPIDVTRRLRPRGSWRVRVVYLGAKPYRGSRSAWIRFRVG